jgi:hypothetical protein
MPYPSIVTVLGASYYGSERRKEQTYTMGQCEAVSYMHHKSWVLGDEGNIFQGQTSLSDRVSRR